MIELLIISLAASFLFTFLMFISIKAEISKLERNRRVPFSGMVGFGITETIKDDEAKFTTARAADSKQVKSKKVIKK